MRRDSFVCYKSFYDAIKQLSDEDFARCMRAICEYALNGAEVDVQGVPSVVFQLVKPQIDANNRKFLNGMRGKEYGKLGGRPKTPETPQENPKKTPKKPQENPKETPNVNVNVNDNVNVNVNDNIKENIKEKKAADKSATKKSLEEREKDFYQSLVPFIDKYDRQMIRDFYDYWSQVNEGGIKMLWEMQKAFEISKRLATWSSRRKASSQTQEESLYRNAPQDKWAQAKKERWI